MHFQLEVKMYYISSVDKYDICVTDTKSGVTNHFDREGIELFIRSGHPVLGVVPYLDSSVNLEKFYYSAVHKESSRQVAQSISYSYEGISSYVEGDSLFGFVQLFNFKSCDEVFSIEVLILYYLLQIYDDVTIWLKSGVSSLSLLFSVICRDYRNFNLAYTLNGEVVSVGCPLEGQLNIDRFVLRYIDLSSREVFRLCVDTQRSLVSVRKELMGSNSI